MSYTVHINQDIAYCYRTLQLTDNSKPGLVARTAQAKGIILYICCSSAGRSGQLSLRRLAVWFLVPAVKIDTARFLYRRVLSSAVCK